MPRPPNEQLELRGAQHAWRFEALLVQLVADALGERRLLRLRHVSPLDRRREIAVSAHNVAMTRRIMR